MGTATLHQTEIMYSADAVIPNPEYKRTTCEHDIAVVRVNGKCGTQNSGGITFDAHPYVNFIKLWEHEVDMSQDFTVGRLQKQA